MKKILSIVFVLSITTLIHAAQVIVFENQIEEKEFLFQKHEIAYRNFRDSGNTNAASIEKQKLIGLQREIDALINQALDDWKADR